MSTKMAQNRVLIVEDEVSINELIKKYEESTSEESEEDI